MKSVIASVIVACALAAGSAGAHTHKIARNGQVLANGANHPEFRSIDGEFISCEDFTLLAGFAPAWYGLETAHHGADAGDPGRGDGCYVVEGGLAPSNPLADRNPAIQ